MSMDPVKRLISIVGVAILFTLLYSVFSTFYTDVEVNQQFPVLEPRHQILAFTLIESSSSAKYPSNGTIYVMSYQKGKVLYIENLSLRIGTTLTAYFSQNSIARDGPLVGSLLSSHGNVTLYIPADIELYDYDYIVFWSTSDQRVLAFANLTQ